MKTSTIKRFGKALLGTAVVGGLCFAPEVFAAGSDATGNSNDLGHVAAQITTNISGVAKLITAASYVSGLGFAVSAILKFKQHKDNSTQIPIGTPIALIFIAAALLFTPSLFNTAGYTMFSSGGTIAGVEGMSDFKSASSQIDS